ncbi:TnsA endonuclease N-terminal domain-containing protein [Aliarcobacter butzleri]|uniref:TnsA endonuclease N-terminal domain-containing protein n=1 Tax=Aliarcobacter butzleri TaxID=28197 RepID=UPI001EDC64A7|nr:TnsA endonuclease N-terminal domain-containing protein [Aliarcobacter butzleri]MCG3706942.1 TnsA endonuclease N-terminal domain-containing protein [Aliarcobacter butzleri]
MEISNNKIPKRKANKTFMSVTGYFPSKKNSRSIFFESMLEKKLFLSLEFDENVLNYLEQPVIIEYTNKNRKTTYCPDCLINYKNSKSKLIEVKYSSELIDREDELKIKFEQAKLYANENNLIFDIFTEKSIEPMKLKNMEFLYSFAFNIKDDEKEKYIIKILKTIEDTTITELLSLLSNNRFEQAKYLPSIWKLVFDNIIDINYKTEQIGMNSTIRLNHE